MFFYSQERYYFEQILLSGTKFINTNYRTSKRLLIPHTYYSNLFILLPLFVISISNQKLCSVDATKFSSSVIIFNFRYLSIMKFNRTMYTK